MTCKQLGGACDVEFNANTFEEVAEVENIFNKLVLYSSDLLHRPNRHFGNDINNSRLVLTIGISKLNLNI